MGDLGFNVVEPFREEFPDRFLNFGISEQSMLSAAAGMSQQGLKPFVYSIGNFPSFRALEQIRNDICANNLEVNIVSVGAGFSYGTAGYSHHLVEDLSVMSIFDDITIFNPSDAIELDQCFNFANNKKATKYWRISKSSDYPPKNSIKCFLGQPPLNKKILFSQLGVFRMK